MADKTPGVNAGRDDLTDSDLPAADPFAELTRIMGFDPRKADGGTRTAAQASSGEDFKIDLEEELMREFGEDEPVEEIAETANEPELEEPLPSLELQSNDDEPEFQAVQTDLEDAVAAFEQAPVDASIEAAAQDLMQAELNGEDPQSVEQDIPVIKLSPVKSAPEPMVVEDEPLLVSADDTAGEAELEAEFNALLGNSEHHEILDTSADTLASVAPTVEQAAQESAQPAVSMAHPEDDFSVDFGFTQPVEALDKVPEPVELIAEIEPDDLLSSEAEVESEEIVAAAEEEVQPVAEVKAEEPAAVEEDDPFAMLAAMAQKYRVSEPNDSWRTSAPQYSRATPQIARTEPQFIRPEPQPIRVEPRATYVEQPVARVEPQAPVIETPAPRVEMPQAFINNRAAPVAPAPEIETVDVPDRAVAVADDLDIPELELAEELPTVAPADDLDAEFNNLLQQMSTPAVAAAAAAPRPAASYAPAPSRPVPTPYQSQALEEPQRSYAEQAYDDADYDEEPVAQSAAYAQPQTSIAPAQPYRQAQPSAATYDERSHGRYNRPATANAQADHDDLGIDLTEDDLAEAFDDFDTAAMDDFDLDGDFDDDVTPAAYQQTQRQPKRRGLLIAAIIGGVAILGVAGAVAMSMMGDAQGSAPELVKADQDPFRVRPENPGGTAMQNEQGKVYDTVARSGDANGQPQDQLISNTEEPVDLPDQLPDNADEDLAVNEDGANKSEDRIQPAAGEETQAADGDTIAVSPRKVRTMVVKPDGSLAPREEIAPQAANDVAAPQNEAAAAPLPGTDDVASAIGDGDQPAKPATEAPAAAPENVAPEQTASIQPQPVVEGGWTMQIASESSEAAAKATYQKMLGRYGEVLDGKGVNIIKADIAGKGTFWRIRIPAESRDAAASLCNNFKSVGGKCFVTKS